MSDELRDRIRAQFGDGIPARVYRADTPLPDVSWREATPEEWAMSPAGVLDARLEKQIVAAADKQLRALGFRVINTSQPRHAKYITPGVPDRFYFHRAKGLGLAWEAKTATGEQSPAQRDFQEDMDACGWPYVLGTDRDLFDWLLARYPLVRDEQGHLIWRRE